MAYEGFHDPSQSCHPLLCILEPNSPLLICERRVDGETTKMEQLDIIIIDLVALGRQEALPVS